MLKAFKSNEGCSTNQIAFLGSGASGTGGWELSATTFDL